MPPVISSTIRSRPCPRFAEPTPERRQFCRRSLPPPEPSPSRIGARRSSEEPPHRAPPPSSTSHRRAPPSGHPLMRARPLLRFGPVFQPSSRVSAFLNWMALLRNYTNTTSQGHKTTQSVVNKKGRARENYLFPASKRPVAPFPLSPILNRVSFYFEFSMAPKRRRRAEDSTTPSRPPPLRTPKPQPVVVFAHGAGAPSSSDWMIHWKEMVRDALDAVEVVTFDYPYMSGGKRRAPPKAEKLVDYHLGVVKDAVAKHEGHPLVLMGKSMGSRVSCMVATYEDINVSAVVCLGYPLKGVNGAVRDETLLQMKVPTMFVQGSKDALCPLDKLESTRWKMTCKNTLHVVDGGDHSLKIGKKHQESTGVNQHNAEMETMKDIAQFVLDSVT